MARRPVVRYGNKIDLGRILGLAFGPKPEEPLRGNIGFNPAYDFQTGNVPFDYKGDPADLAYPYQNVGRGVVENNRVLAQIQEQANEIEARRALQQAQATEAQQAIKLKEQLDLENKMRFYGYDPITNQKVVGQPWQRAEENSKFWINNNIVPGTTINALATPSMDAARSKMLENAAVSGQKELLAKIGLEAMEENRPEFLKGAVAEGMAPYYKNFISIPQGGATLDPATQNLYLGPSSRTVGTPPTIPDIKGLKPETAVLLQGLAALKPPIKTTQTTPFTVSNLLGQATGPTLNVAPNSTNATSTDTVMMPLAKDLTLPDGTVIKAGTPYPHKRKIVP